MAQPTEFLTIKLPFQLFSAGLHTIEFRMEENDGQDSYYLYWNGPDSGNSWQIIPNTPFVAGGGLYLSTYKLDSPASTITNLDVRVKVCDPDWTWKQIVSNIPMDNINLSVCCNGMENRSACILV